MSVKDSPDANVSRETLALYEQILKDWQSRINLVSASTLSDLCNRHFLDSLQLVPVIQSITPAPAQAGVSFETILTDLGSGAGFPGMVLALSGIPNVHLIESDQRKCAFLREISRTCFDVSRETFRPTIHNDRIEKLNLKADIITSRAFADLNKTLEISENLRHPDTLYLLLKPLDLQKELTEAAQNWYFDHEIIPSISDVRGCILKISRVNKK